MRNIFSPQLIQTDPTSRNANTATAYFKTLIPSTLKLSYRLLKQLFANRPRVQTIDLTRTLVGGLLNYDAGRFMLQNKINELCLALVGGLLTYDASRWAELSGDMRAASMLLVDSPDVALLYQYRTLKEDLFCWWNFEKTSYYQTALSSIEIFGNFHGHRTRDGILSEARSFVTLYERMLNDDQSQVKFSFPLAHSTPRSLPIVCRTLTPDTVQILDGHHRLAIAWLLGRRTVLATVLGSQATPLQALVLSAIAANGRRKLYQPIYGPEFDRSWVLVRRCQDRLEMMLRFLDTRGYRIPDLSILDLGCSYGWFVSEFLNHGSDVVGVDLDPAHLKIGRIAYGLHADRLVQSSRQDFLRNCHRVFDIVLCLSGLHDFALKPDFGAPEEILHRLDGITGSCLFVETGQSHEKWYRHSLPQWNNDFIINLIKRHTSFTQVLPIGVDSDNVGPFRDNYGRTLFACVRS